MVAFLKSIQIILIDNNLHRMGEHPEKGSPVYPWSQVHIGTCFTTLQLAWYPQEPGQGSLHLSEIHAKLPGHSTFIIHSGLQLGGRPT